MSLFAKPIAQHAAKSVLVVTLALSGCQALPGEGPAALEITEAAGKSGAQKDRADAVVFEVVEVDSYSARLVSDFTAQMLSRQFGIGTSDVSATLGVGDEVLVSIFEAGENGLFSTSESKRTDLQLTVQADGTVSIPYVGSVRFAGRTPDQVRGAILAELEGKAVEPDVIVNTVETNSRVVTVNGAVQSSSQVPLDLDGDRISDVIAKAGGPSNEPSETFVTLARNGETATVPLAAIFDDPSENIFVQPDDQIFVTFEPRTFTVLGQTVQNGRIPFGATELNLVEAIALAGGGNDTSVDAKGFFVFRYEEAGIVKLLLGDQRFNELVNKGMAPDKFGRYPIVYRFNMEHPDSFIIGQTFPVKNRDVIYASRHPTVDFQRFLNLISQPVGVARGTISLSSSVE